MRTSRLLFLLTFLALPLLAYGETGASISCTGILSEFSGSYFMPQENIYFSSNVMLLRRDRELEKAVEHFSSSLRSLSGVTCDLRSRRLMNRKLLDMKQSREWIGETLGFRNDPTYLMPVIGRKVNPSPTALPNAPRPYRASTTDGIHHGIDLYGAYGTPVIAPSPGVVIRRVDGFTPSWFDRIIGGRHLNALERAHNLDVYRGNQVWLVLPTGTIAVYSHLSSISESLFIGKIVDRGEILGAIGTSGVPGGSSYRNYHLHLELYDTVEFTGSIPDPDTVMLSDWKWRETPARDLPNAVTSFFSR